MARLDAKKAKKIRDFKSKWDRHFGQNIIQYHDFMEFILGEQWNEDESKVFNSYQKTPLTFNFIAPMANNLVGEQQSQTPSIQCVPRSQVPVQTARVREALVKEISFNSKSKEITQNAIFKAAVGGYAAYGITKEYDNDYDFIQNIRMFDIEDPTKCFWDITAKHKTKYDGMGSGFCTTMSRTMFKSIYGVALSRKIGNSSTDISDADDTQYTWADDDNVTIIDYFERKYSTFTLYQLSNGRSYTQDQIDTMPATEIEGINFIMDEDGEPQKIVNEREVPRYKVKHSKWCGDYELEKTDLPGTKLPLLFHDQWSYTDKNGKQICRPFFKDCRDAQRFLNYLKTQIAYLIKISRNDQFMAAKGNVRGADTAATWNDPTTVQGLLVYDEIASGNKPERIAPVEISQTLTQQASLAQMDIQATAGMYASQQGAPSADNSGKAIDARGNRQSYSTWIIRNAANITLAAAAEIINEWIPEVYDTERNHQLTLPDAGTADVTLNKQKDDYGTQTENDMTTGVYSIKLVAGVSYEDQKEENLNAMEMMLRYAPENFKNVGDLFAENLPMANSTELKNRMRAMVDPDILKAGLTGQPLPPKQDAPNPELLMIQLKTQELEAKKEKNQMDAQLAQAKLQHEQDKLQLQAHRDGADMSIQIADIKAKEKETAAQFALEDKKLQAEIERTAAQAASVHHNNLAKILTHNTSYLNPPKPTAQKDGK